MTPTSRPNATARNPSLTRIGFPKGYLYVREEPTSASGVAASASTAWKWCPVLNKLCNPEDCAWGSNGECSVAVLARFASYGFNKEEARAT